LLLAALNALCTAKLNSYSSVQKKSKPPNTGTETLSATERKHLSTVWMGIFVQKIIQNIARSTTAQNSHRKDR